MKENQIRELVNELRDIAIEYHGTQQLRERIARTVRAAWHHELEKPNQPVSQTYELPQTQLEQVADLYEMQFDDGRTCAFHTDGAKAAQWLLACDGNKVQEYVRIERYQEAVIGNSPVTPDGWISCSERMPDNDESKPIAIFTGKCLGQGMFVATYDDDGFFDYWEGMEIIGVTHWMPLPAPPQQEVK
ncbi:DUF551 domain-containing protein [Salmonella enterica]|nr:DUF551 domain-containing protein [Salmonella enterica]EFR2904514.1 DUF551 domain-containing protein [Salmonella enterica]